MLACLHLFFHGFDKKDISHFNDQYMMVTNQLYLFFLKRFSCLMYQGSFIHCQSVQHLMFTNVMPKRVQQALEM